MCNMLLAILTVFLSLCVSIGDAEAARFGGGRSFGMQRQSITPRSLSPQGLAPAPASAPANPSTPTTPQRNWGGALGGLAAGLGLAALFSHVGVGAGMGNLLTIVFLALAAVFIFKLLFRPDFSPSQTSSNGLQYPAMAAEVPTESAVVHDLRVADLPAGFDSEAFVRIAKVNFIRLQAANDSKNLEDIREFVSPEVYGEIKIQMDERGSIVQQTDVIALNAELLEVTTEPTRHIASVRFSGLIREAANAPAVPFSEVWSLSKPVKGHTGWFVAGIRQQS